MNRKFQYIRQQMKYRPFRSLFPNRMGKSTNVRFVRSMTKKELEEEFQLIIKKKSKLSSVVRSMVTIRYYYEKSQEEKKTREEEE